jgi:hypothetical protein
MCAARLANFFLFAVHAADMDAFVNFAELGPDWDMLSRGLFISCLMDAVEHDKPQVQVRMQVLSAKAFVVLTNMLTQTWP